MNTLFGYPREQETGKDSQGKELDEPHQEGLGICLQKQGPMKSASSDMQKEHIREGLSAVQESLTLSKPIVHTTRASHF